MKGVAKAKSTPNEITSAIQVLEQLSRYIDNEAEGSIYRTRKWFLESGRADQIARHALERMQALDSIIRDLRQWAFSQDNQKPLERNRTSST
jgi:hypothetical protein